MAQKSPEVDAWLAAKDHPQDALIRKLRAVLLASHPGIEECIKWSSPTFTYKGNLASVNPQAKAFVSLLFHQGAKIPGSHAILEGGGGTARYARIESAADLKAKTPALRKVVQAWVAMQDAAGARRR